MKKKMILFLLLLCLNVTVLLLSFYVINNAQSQLPSATQMNYNLRSDHSPLKITDIQRLSDRISMNGITFCSELDNADIKGESVTPVLTNENFFAVYNMNISGSAITEQMMNNKEKVAVIGSSLALKLYFNTDAVGRSIEINNEEYLICGVYEERENVINRISSDGKQRIYIPYTCYNEFEDSDVDTITYQNGSDSAPLIAQMNLEQYHATDLSEKSKVTEDFEHIIFLVLFSVLCVVSLKVWLKLCKRFCHDIRESLNEHYFWNSVKSIPIKYLLLIVIAIGVPTALLAVFFISDFSIYIPSKYIPYDNIFDFSSYLNVIVDNSNTKNAMALMGNTYLPELYSNTFSVLPWMTGIFILLFVVLVLFAVGLKKEIFRKFNRE